jgi:IclR family KDG regulon transcriptional repressor
VSTSLVKIFKILEAVIESDTPRGISELAREMNVDKSAVQRAFSGLQKAGYIAKETGTSRYRPTLRVWELGAKVIASHEAFRLVHPVLRYAAKESGLTAYFAWVQLPDMLYVDKVDGDKGRPNSSQPGRRVPIYRTAAGRAVMPFLEEDALAAVRARASAGAGAQKRESSAEFAAALQDMPRIKNRMYAITQSGSFAQVNSIAAPVWALDDAPVGSIVLSSDASTLPESDFEKIGHIALATAEQATRALGGRYPTSRFDTA